MPTSGCCVPLCTKKGGFRFPGDLQLRKKWIIAIRRDIWTPSKWSIVCHAHFKQEDFMHITQHGVKPLRKQLKAGTVPSLFAWTSSPSASALSRAARMKIRELPKVEPPLPWQGEDIAEEIVESRDLDSVTDDLANTLANSITTGVKATQTKDGLNNLRIEGLMFNDKAIHYYTGLECFTKFQMVFDTLGQAAFHLKYRWRQAENLSVENQFFLTLIKLRRNTPDFELSLNFGISEFSVSNIFTTWVNFMYLQWKEINIWPSRELVSLYMPSDFKRKFPTTRVILDGMEIPIMKPSAPLAQQITFSHYKNKNTLKIIVGASPGGLVTSIPQAYGGSASDRSLVECSDLFQKCEDHDSIMADKGFNIQDLFATKNISVNIPTLMKGINQLSGMKLLHDRKISSQRIHIERLIGLGKTYVILRKPLTITQTVIGSRIIFVCFMLCNFRKCIIGKDA